MPRGSKPGERRGGRKKGTPNKTTAEAREAFRMVYEGRLVDLDRWITETGDGYDVERLNTKGEVVKVREGKDPASAAKILVAMAEHFVPKLARHEHVGEDGGPVRVIKVDMDE